MNTWYVIAKPDKRYKYAFKPLFNRSKVFHTFKRAIKIKNLKEHETKKPLVILKRTCQLIERS
jgi:hypothetical protein